MLVKIDSEVKIEIGFFEYRMKNLWGSNNIHSTTLSFHVVVSPLTPSIASYVALSLIFYFLISSHSLIIQ